MSAAADPVRRFSGAVDGRDTVVVGVPQAGSGVPMFSEWPAAFGDVPFLRYHIPGRDRRRKEPAPTSIEHLCDDLESAVRGLGVRGVVLTGHCMGALVADAVAARLSRDLRVAVVLSSVRPAREGLYGAYASTMSDDEILAIMNAAQQAAGRPAVHAALAGLAVRSLREDVLLLTDYLGEGGEQDHPRTVVHWSEDPFVPGSDLDHWKGFAATTVVPADGPPEQYLTAGNVAIRCVQQLCAVAGSG
jgi:surfactin synthase thioesterase subunit